MSHHPACGIKREPQQQRSRLLTEKVCYATLELVAQRGQPDVKTRLFACFAGMVISPGSRFLPGEQAGLSLEEIHSDSLRSRYDTPLA